MRPCRAFSEDEVRRLFAIAGRRRLAYQMLLYTGQRKSEVRALMWSDVHLDEAQPYALFRESTTKDKDKRAVPLRPEIVEQLKALRPKPEETHTLSKPIFWFRWPTYDLLRGDFKRAGIERVDALGRSVRFHPFRKTWQTLGVRYGINQRVAQEVCYDKAPVLERLLIDQIVLAKLRVIWAEAKYTACLSSAEISNRTARFWDDALSSAHSRFRRALETLSRIQRIGAANPGVQINIASDGGQQVNVNGKVQTAGAASPA